MLRSSNVKEVVKNEEKRKIDYTKTEALNAVINLANKSGGTFPFQEDYEEAEANREIDIDGLIKAFGVASSMEYTKVRPYAAINIAALREIRRREGKPERIVLEDPSTRWVRSIKQI